ncbi:MAG: hypothetical protein AB7U98_13750 [Candidatus Nitrosocosmicus sp.]
MRIEHLETDNTKLCHARPGDVVQFISPELFPMPGYFMICFMATAEAKAKACKPNQPQGLYADGRDIYCLNLETGELFLPPSFSQRCRIYRKAVLQLQSKEIA